MTMTPEMGTLKSRLRSTWMAGDYGQLAQYLEPGALKFLERIAVAPGARLLDVACGAGQIAIPLARAGVQVTALDLAPNLIEQAKARAAAENLKIQFEEGDAEMLPFEDESFDMVVSLIGAMFAPRPERVAAEMIRVCRPGGRIAMGNWTAEGFIGQMFKATARHAPPSPLMASPVQWGAEPVVRQRLSDRIARLECVKRLYPMSFPFSPAEVVEFFRTYYGPVNRAFASLDADGQAALRQDLEQLWAANNLSSDGSTSVEAEYLEVMAYRA
jgi:SAM-dependent methyltransferase